MPTDGDVYERLSAPFDITFSDTRGGVAITYISGEQVVSRLNEVLGVGGWNFRVLQHEIHADADEAWVLGELIAVIDGTSVIRQQFGSQKLRRSRSTGTPLDLGFDLKGAGTDAMKKCASLLGVGLYLSRKEGVPARATSRHTPPRPAVRQQPSQPAKIICKDCSSEIMTAIILGKEYTPSALANLGQQHARKPLCADCLTKNGWRPQSATG